jgi:PqqA peptide cyclase
MTKPLTIADRVVTIPPPMALLAELTHRCPLACGYCSNPVELKHSDAELSTDDWISVFRQAARLGVLHLHLSGGEPCSRRDLEHLVGAAAEAGLYSNLITSGIGLTQRRFEQLSIHGLDHVQLSLQGTTEEISDHIGGYRGGFKRKLMVAEWVTGSGLPLTLNVVCHRHNMDEIDSMIEMAVRLGARRLEVATVQFHGWAEVNRGYFLPTREQVETVTRRVETARRELDGKLVIDYVPADYYAKYPKACMGGWGRIGLNVDPSGRVMPCHAAETIPGLEFDNVRDRPLDDIWYNGSAFQRFRGTDWMQEPCRSCDRKTVDFGGCRCQAMALSGNAAAADPVCMHSPDRGRVDRILRDELARSQNSEMVYRGRA